jgi:hypothetical protein
LQQQDVPQQGAQQQGIQEQQQAEHSDAVMASASQPMSHEDNKPSMTGAGHGVAAAPAGPLIAPIPAGAAAGEAGTDNAGGGGGSDVPMETQGFTEGADRLQGASSSSSMTGTDGGVPPNIVGSNSNGNSTRNGVLHPGHTNGVTNGVTSSAWGMGCGRPTSRSRPASAWSPVESRVRIQRVKALKALGQIKVGRVARGVHWGTW